MIVDFGGGHGGGDKGKHSQKSIIATPLLDDSILVMFWGLRLFQYVFFLCVFEPSRPLV